MTWWSLKRALRNRVDAEVDASDKMREERRLARAAARGRWRLLPWISMLVWIPIAFGAMSFGRDSINYILALLLLWSLGEIFAKAAQFRAKLFDAPELAIFDFLPISDSQIFREQGRSFLRGTVWLACGLSLGYMMLLSKSGMGWRALPGGMALGAVQWLFTISIALCLVAYAPPRRFAVLGAFFHFGAVGVILLGSRTPAICQWLAHWAWVSPPMGWIIQSLGLSQQGGWLYMLTPSLMSASVLALSPFAYRRALQSFLRTEPQHETDGRNAEVIEFGEEMVQSPIESITAIQSGRFMAEFDWKSAGFLEGLLSRWLNSRERSIAEYMLGRDPNWNSTVKRSRLGGGVLAAVWWAESRYVGSNNFGFLILLGFSTLVSFFSSLPGFSLPPNGGLTSPYFAMYPIGFWEMARTVIKINIVKMTVGIPYLLAFFAVPMIGILAPGAGTCLRVVFVVLAIQPAVIVGSISHRTNDTRYASMVLLAILAMLVMVVAGIVLFAATTFLVVGLAGIAFAVMSGVVLIMYGRWFDQSRFDLVPIRRIDEDDPMRNE